MRQTFTAQELDGMEFEFEQVYDTAAVKWWSFGDGSAMAPRFLLARIGFQPYQDWMEEFHTEQAAKPGQRQAAKTKGNPKVKRRIREGLEKFIVQGLELGSGKKKEALLSVSKVGEAVTLPAAMPRRLLEISLRAEDGSWEEPLARDEFDLEGRELRLVRWFEPEAEKAPEPAEGEEPEGEDEEVELVCEERNWPRAGADQVRIRYWEKLVLFDPVEPEESTVTRAQLALLVRRFLKQPDYYRDLLECSGRTEDYMRSRMAADEKKYAAAFSTLSAGEEATS